MLQGLLQILGTLFGWIGSLLPDSPLSQWAVVTEDMSLGIAWLNWFVPISEMLVMITLWIAAMGIVTAVKVGLQMTTSVGGKVVGQ